MSALYADPLTLYARRHDLDRLHERGRRAGGQERVLERRRDVLLDAFEQVLVGLRVATDRQVWRGTP